MALFQLNMKTRPLAGEVDDASIIFGAKDGQADAAPEPFTVATLWTHIASKIGGQPFGLSLLNLVSAAALRAAIALPNTTTVGRLARYTDAAGAQGETIGLYEDAAGLVGIGTASPAAHLHVRGTGIVKARVESSDNQANLDLIGGGVSNFAQITSLNGELYINTQAASKDMIFRVGSVTERMRISGSTGKVTLTAAASLPAATSAAVGPFELGTYRLMGRNGCLFGGLNSGNFTQTGSGNIGLGAYTLDALTAGTHNVALGDFAGSGLTTGNYNFALGNGALQSETTGTSHVALGAYSLNAANGSFYNTAVGDSAMRTLTTGSYSVAIGRNAGRSFTTGNYNIEIGYQNPGGSGVTTGSGNTIIGSLISGLSATLSNTIVIADGAGNQRAIIDSASAYIAAAKLDVNGDTVRLRTPRTPASASASGNAGDICYDANFVYVCTATNTWKRSALSTW